MRRPVLLALALSLAAFGASAQTAGQKPPPYQPGPAPTAAQPAEPAPSMDVTLHSNPFRPQDETIAVFAEAYARAGRPRLAFYWNRQLSELMGQWQSDSRSVMTEKRTESSEGSWDLRQQGERQRAVETQRRLPDQPGRPTRPETWEWEFQDGFLGAFLKADANVVDRVAITRIMGVGAEDMDPKSVEMMALQGYADLLVEVLPADSARSTTGYELRARVLDTKTGRILALVNSRGLKEWRQKPKAVATSRGFEIPDDDDEGFGPEAGGGTYKATATGFDKRRKPPRPDAVAHNLATNVMSALIPKLDGTATVKSEPLPPAVQSRPEVKAVPGPMAITPQVAKPKPIPNQSAVPLPEVETRPLPPPSAPAPDEPPMPKPTKQ